MNIYRKWINFFIMPIAKILFLLTLAWNVSYGCATCTLMVPSVEVEADIKIEDNKLKNIHFVWNFSEDYTNTLMSQYDKNRNSQYDKDELDHIRQAMLDYLVEKQMVTLIHYSEENATEPTELMPKYGNFTLNLVNDRLIFTYYGTLETTIHDNARLSLLLKDYEGFFTFKITQLNISKSDFAYSKNLYLFTASMLFRDKSLIHELPSQKVKQNTVTQALTEAEDSTESYQENLLKTTMIKIKSLFESIKDEKNPMTYLFLLFFAYLYGVVHALGPGHGKTLVASYFISNDRSYMKAFFISLSIGVVHTFSAFILTVVIYFLVNTLMSQFLDDTVFYTTKISALIIIAIAIYLIQKQYRLYKQIEKEKNMPQFTTFSNSPLHASTCGCGSCKVDKDSTDVALIISAGIIPCPGTTTLFIFAISTGLYYAGFISALVMSLGMSSVIFVSALLSTVIRKKVLRPNEKLKKYLEFISLSLILVLGAILLFV